MFEDPYADGSTDGAAYPALDVEDDWSYPGYPEEDGEGDDPSGDGAELIACTADAPLKDVELDVFTAFMTTEGWGPNNRESVALLTWPGPRQKERANPSRELTPTDLAPAPCPLKTDDERCRRSRPSQPVRCVAAVVTGQETRSARASQKARRTYHARLTPVAYMGFFDGEDFAASDEELLDESPGGVTSQGSPWDVLDYPERGRHTVQLWHAPWKHVPRSASATRRLLPLGTAGEEAKSSAHGLLDLGCTGTSLCLLLEPGQQP